MTIVLILILIVSVLNLAFAWVLFRMHSKKDKTGFPLWYFPREFGKSFLTSSEQITFSQEKIFVMLEAISDNLLNQFKLIEEMESRIENRVVEKTSLNPPFAVGRKKK